MTTKDATTTDMTTNASNTIEVTTVDANDTEMALDRFVAFETSIEQIKEMLAANLGTTTMTAMDFERIKIPSGGGTAWTVPEIDGEQMHRELSGIILMWREVRTYWKLPMDQSEGSAPPDCSSMDGRMGIGSPGGSCHSCQFAQFGSDSRGEGQACKLARQVVLLRKENLLPDIVSLPASSIKPARSYLQRLATKGLPCYSLISKIGLEKAQNAQGIVYSRATFTAGESLHPEQAGHARAYAAMLKTFIEAVPPAAISKASQPEDGEVV